MNYHLPLAWSISPMLCGHTQTYPPCGFHTPCTCLGILRTIRVKSPCNAKVPLDTYVISNRFLDEPHSKAWRPRRHLYSPETLLLHNHPPEVPKGSSRPGEMQNWWHFRGIIVQTPNKSPHQHTIPAPITATPRPPSPAHIPSSHPHPPKSTIPKSGWCISEPPSRS